MHILRRALDEDRELAAIVAGLEERIAGNPIKLGLVLDLNPWWLAIFRLHGAGLLLEHPVIWPAPYMSLAAAPFVQGARAPLDLSWWHFTVGTLTEEAFGRPIAPRPYLIRIAALPRGDEHAYHHDQLLAAARETPIATVVEFHEPPRLVAACGDRVVGPVTHGTLGGFVEDRRSGRRYAVTCGHVISSGAARTLTGPLGPCVHAVTPTPLPGGVRCSARCGTVTELDAALIDIGTMRVANVASSVATDVANGDTVVMDGAVSGAVTYEVGGYVVNYEIGGACWTGLIQFHAPVLTGILPVSFQVATTPLPRGGDSGAWLIRNGTEWAGMVVASGHLHGFALDADGLLSRLDASTGTTRLGLV